MQFVGLDTVGANGFSGLSFDTVTNKPLMVGFFAIDTLIGKSADTLRGLYVTDSTWTLGSTLNYSDGSHSLPLSGFGTLMGSPGNDTFNVAGASIPAALTLDGGGGTSNVLNFDAGGLNVTETTSSVQAGSHPVVSYGGLSAINVTNTSGNYTFADAGDNDILRFFEASSGFQFQLNGGAAVVLGLINSFTFNAAGSNALMIVDNSTSASGVLAIPTGGVAFNGPGASKGGTLRYLGNSTESVTYTPSATTQGSGKAVVSAGSTTGNLTFTGLSPLDVTGVANAKITLPSANNQLAVDNGTVTVGGSSTPVVIVSGTSGGVGVEAFRVWNDSAVTIDTSSPAGNDTITVNSASAPGALKNFSIVTGTGTDTVQLNGPINVSGAFSIQTDTITSTTSGTITAATITQTAGGTSTFNGLLHATGGGISVSGIALTGTNFTITGGMTTSIAVGVISLIRASGTLDIHTNPVNLGGASLSVTNGGAGTISSAIIGGGSLTKDGSGTLTLSSTANDFGPTTVNAGTLALGATNTLPTTTDLLVNAGASLDLAGFDQAVAAITGDGTITNSRVSVNTLTVANAAADTFAGTLTGMLALAKSNSGTLTLGSPNTYTGGTTISTGTLANGVVNALPTATALTVNGGTFDLAGFAQQLGSMTGAGTITNSAPSTQTLTLTNTAADTFAGLLSGALALTVNGSGVLTLANSVNSYTGDTTIDKGAGISVAADRSLGNVGSGLVLNGGTLLTTATFMSARGVTLSAASTLDIANSTTLTLSGVLSGAANLTKTDSGNLSLLGSSGAYSGTLSFVTGTLLVNGTLGGSVAANGGTLLAGTGSIGALTGASVAALNPGNNGPGTLTVGTTVLTSGFTYLADVNGVSAAAHDLVQSTSTVNLNGATLTLMIGTGFPKITAPGTSLTLVHTAAGLAGTFAGLPDGATIHPVPGNQAVAFAIHYTSTDAVLLPIANVNVVGATAGQTPLVIVQNSDGTTRFQLMAFDASFTGGVSTALGDVNNDGIPDFIVGAGPGGGPSVAVFNGADGSYLYSFFAFDPRFTGGVSVAVGDVNHDRFGDIVVGAGPGGGPNVLVISGKDHQTVLDNWMAFDPGFTGGVTVASGDVNGDGFADVIVGAGPGGGPSVAVFDGHGGHLLASYFAYNPQFTGGVVVAAGDVRGTGTAQVLTGPGMGGGPSVQEIDALSGKQLASFFAYPQSMVLGVRVGLGRSASNGQLVLLTGEGALAPGFDQGFDGLTLQAIDQFFAAAT